MLGAGPILALALGLSGLSRIKRAELRIADLEVDLDGLRRRLAAGPVAAEAKAPAAPAPAPAPVPDPRPLDPPAAALPPEEDRDEAPTDAPAEAPAEAPAPAPAPRPVQAPAGIRLPPTRPKTPLSPERLAVWFGSAVGGFLVLLASLFALSVAIEKGWLGPSVRVFLGLSAGTALWQLGGWLRRRNYRLIPSAVIGAAMGVLFGTLYAASGLYHLVGPAPTFLLMAAVAGVALATAIRHDDRFMAWLGLVGGLLVPVLVSTGENRPLALFSYLVVLTSGALMAASRRGWPDLVLGAMIGAGAMFLGWTARFYLPDQVPAALLATAALLLPFAGIAARPASPPWVSRAAALATTGLPLLALPWIVPLDPIFWDPRSGVEVVRDLGTAPYLGIAAVLLLPLPAGWLARRMDHGAATGLSLVPAVLLTLIFAVGWTDHPEGPHALVALAVLGSLLTALAWTARKPALAPARLPLPLAAGLLASALLVEADAVSAGVIIAYTGGLALIGSGAAALGRQPWLLLTTLGGAGFAAFAAAGPPLMVEQPQVVPVAAGAVLAYGLLATLPLHRRILGEARDPAITAALAGPVFFWPLYRCWQQSLGDPLVGALPIIQGAAALLGAAVVVRSLRAHTDSGLLAAFVAVALLGVNTAIPLQLENQWLTLAWALEAAALARLGHRLGHPFVRLAAVGLAVTVAVRLLLNPFALEYGDTSGLPLLNWTLYTWGVPAAALLLTAHWIRPSVGSRAPKGELWEKQLPGILVLLAIFLCFALVNVQVSDLFQDQGPVELGGKGLWQGMVRSLSWAAYGVALLVVGLMRKSRMVRLVGFAFVMLAAGKVFVLDLWSLSGFVRVGSVLGLGISLLLAAFLFERLVLRERDAPDDPEQP